MPDFDTAIKCLQSNLEILEEPLTDEQRVLWNLNNALLVVCDALADQEFRLDRIETLQRQATHRQ